MHSLNTACFLDFDHTLFNTDEFFHVDVRNAFLRLEIDAAYWEQSYAAVWPTGYTLEKHAEEVYLRSGSKLPRSEEHTSELQSRLHLVCRLLLEKKKKQ